MIPHYYQPDTTWRIFGANSEEEYVDKFVVKGLFHSNVHEDVSKSYQVVEHTLALSYYHYPMYDLAIDKLLRIFEMAMNLRCEELGIEKTYLDKKNHKQKKTLNRLIDELIDVGLIPEFKSVFHNTRLLRNYASHPERHTLMGTIAGQIIYPVLNLINLIFIDKEFHIEDRKQIEKTKILIESIQMNLFILEHEKQKILVYDIDMHDCYKRGNDWIYVFSFMPVVTDAQLRISNHQPPERIVRFIKNPIIDDVSIKGYELSLDMNILVLKTDKVENQNKLESQLKVVREAKSVDAFTFMESSKHDVDQKSQQFIYENRWENNTPVGTSNTK